MDFELLEKTVESALSSRAKTIYELSQAVNASPFALPGVLQKLRAEGKCVRITTSSRMNPNEQKRVYKYLAGGSHVS